MAEQARQRVLFCGFRTIENVEAYFKNSSLERGRRLYEAKHVYEVREEICIAPGPSDIFGKCAAQMKTAVYDVRLELSAEPRIVTDASCTCKAGCRGWCKHAAALAVFVNSHRHESCTDLPCAWRRPASRPTLDTKKSVKELFESRPLPVPILQPLCPMSFHAQFREVNCAFADMLKEEEKCQIEKECSAALSALIGRVVDKEDTDLIRRCLSGERQLHTVLEVTSVCPLKFKRTDMLYSVSEKEQGFYKKLVDKNFEEIIEIALLTRGQAAQTRWHKERRLRITSSTAHRVKTRQSKFEDLADSLVKGRGFSTAATLYGKRTEDEARIELSMALAAQIHEVGLIINPQQPWLSCSPDGIFCARDTIYLVEIKCPFSLKDSCLIDHEKQISFVPYIHYVNGCLALKKQHPYYTQVMLMLYILNLQHALLYVYSRVRSVTVHIDRDDGFLAEYVPKLENFYFRYMLKVLTECLS